jgi:diacylglycerol kinase (ATP)
MNPETAFVVLNPMAGISKAGHIERVIAQGLDEAGWTYTIHTTTEGEDIAEVVRNAVRDEYSVVIAAGGDGTVSAAGDGLVGSGIPLGIVPSGTGNALARDMGIPINAARAVALITGANRRRSIDALRLNDHHYFLNLSIGVSAAAMTDTEQTEKRRLGIVAYLITGIQKIVGLQPAGFELRIDGAYRYVHAADIVITNCGIIGVSALKLAPDSAVDDGEVAVCIIRGRTVFDYLSALVNSLLRRSRNQRIECVPARESVTIEATRPLPLQADGDPLGRQNAEVQIVPQALELLIPTKEDHKPNNWWRLAQR